MARGSTSGQKSQSKELTFFAQTTLIVRCKCKLDCRCSRHSDKRSISTGTTAQAAANCRRLKQLLVRLHKPLVMKEKGTPCLDDALLRAPFTPSTSRERSTARLGPHPAGTRTLRRLSRPGGTEIRPVPPHCSRDLGHGPGAGSGHLPRLQPPACSLPVSGVGMGLFVCGFFNAVSRPQLSCCSSLCDVGPLSVNVHYPRCMIPGLYENIQYNLSLSFHSGRPPRLATGAKDLAVRGYLTASRTRNSFSLSVTAP